LSKATINIAWKTSAMDCSYYHDARETAIWTTTKLFFKADWLSSWSFAQAQVSLFFALKINVEQ